MKLQTLTVLSLATATLTWAVPSEINYQGRLTDANGDAVTGDVTMSLKMFDAATDGNEIYSEDIGTVTLDSNGIYSFEFGASGQSVVSASETIATTDGTNSIFNATLENLPVDGSVSISDGTYTWSQANGSSSSTEFTASVTPSSGAVSAIYLGSDLTSSTDITASYNYMDTTVSGALSSHASHWLELSVDGSAQSPRERILSVPFAQVAGNSVQNRIFTKQLDKYVGTIAINTFRNGSNSPVYLDSNFVCIYPSARLATAGPVGYPGSAVLTLENPTFVRYTYGMRNDLPTTFNYEDGTSSNAVNGSEEYDRNTSWANPHPGKKVVSVYARYTDTNNAKNISAVLLEPVYEIINIENIPSHASKVFVTINSINYLSTDIATIELNGQLGDQILKENEYTELNASIGQINSVTVGIIPTKLETGYTSPYISGISLRFL